MPYQLHHEDDWLWARGAVLSWDGTARSTVCATRNWWQSKARPWIPVITLGLYTHALWQLLEPLKLVNLFEDRQSTPERTLKWLPSCTLAFCNRVADSYSCLASHPFNLFGPLTLYSFVHISETQWAWPCRVAPFCVVFAVFSGETQIWPGDLRVVAVAVFCLLSLFLCFHHVLRSKEFHFLHPFLPLLSLSQDRAL